MAQWPSRPAPRGSLRLDQWLARVREMGASDLLLVAGAPPTARVEGRMAPLGGEAPLDGDDIVQAVLGALPPHAQQAFQAGLAADARLLVGGGRLRVNLHRERGRAAAAIRVLPAQPPQLAALNLPPGVEALSRLPRGLVLIGGATGTGKTTTLAASSTRSTATRRAYRHDRGPDRFEHSAPVKSSSSRSRSASMRRTSRRRSEPRSVRRLM